MLAAQPLRARGPAAVSSYFWDPHACFGSLSRAGSLLTPARKAAGLSALGGFLGFACDGPGSVSRAGSLLTLLFAPSLGGRESESDLLLSVARKREEAAC